MVGGKEPWLGVKGQWFFMLALGLFVGSSGRQARTGGARAFSVFIQCGPAIFAVAPAPSELERWHEAWNETAVPDCW